MTTKNAILIVQFAMAKVKEGSGLVEATLQGAKMRLRPIVMTSLAFGFGVLPLALATGAGAGAQTAIGTGVLGGMVTSTFLAIFFIPLFYVVVVRLFGRKKDSQQHVRWLMSLAETDGLRRDLDELVLIDIGDALFQAHSDRGGKNDVFIRP